MPEEVEAVAVVFRGVFLLNYPLCFLMSSTKNTYERKGSNSSAIQDEQKTNRKGLVTKHDGQSFGSR